MSDVTFWYMMHALPSRVMCFDSHSTETGIIKCCHFIVREMCPAIIQTPYLFTLQPSVLFGHCHTVAVF